MRWIVIAGLVALAGCQGVVGPLERFCRNEPVANPCLSRPEQEQRRRDQLALPIDSPLIGPPTSADSPFGRRP
jgi:hypothetical protein